MLRCDGCREWFHQRCVAIDDELFENLSQPKVPYTCPQCTAVNSSDQQQSANSDPEETKEQQIARDVSIVLIDLLVISYVCVCLTSLPYNALAKSANSSALGGGLHQPPSTFGKWKAHPQVQYTVDRAYENG